MVAGALGPAGVAAAGTRARAGLLAASTSATMALAVGKHLAQPARCRDKGSQHCWKHVQLIFPKLAFPAALADLIPTTKRGIEMIASLLCAATRPRSARAPVAATGALRARRSRSEYRTEAQY